MAGESRGEITVLDNPISTKQKVVEQKSVSICSTTSATQIASWNKLSIDLDSGLR